MVVEDSGCVCRINDRVISVNGMPMENVTHASAINVLKESGNSVVLVSLVASPRLQGHLSTSRSSPSSSFRHITSDRWQPFPSSDCDVWQPVRPVMFLSTA